MTKDLFERIKTIAAAGDHLSFTTLVALSGLKPEKDFQFADLSGVSFEGCDLDGFDFSGARLVGCDFTGARIRGARFDQTEVDRAYAGQVRSDRTDLRSAFDWQRFCNENSHKNEIRSDDHLSVGAVFRDCPIGPEMVVVPGGHVAYRSDGEVRDHTFTRPFAVCRFPITEWELLTLPKVLRNARRSAGSDSWDVPATDVSDVDRYAYRSLLSSVAGREYMFLEQSHWAHVFGGGHELQFSIRYGGRQGKMKRPISRFAANNFGVVHANIPEVGAYQDVLRSF